MNCAIHQQGGLVAPSPSKPKAKPPKTYLYGNARLAQIDPGAV